MKVKVNDRGPFAQDRVIDLSVSAAEKIGLTLEAPHSTKSCIAPASCHRGKIPTLTRTSGEDPAAAACAGSDSPGYRSAEGKIEQDQPWDRQADQQQRKNSHAPGRAVLPSWLAAFLAMTHPPSFDGFRS